MSNLLGVATVVTLMLAALAGVGASIRWVWQQLRGINRVVDVITGVPPGPGMPHGRPGLLDRLDRIEAAVGQVVPRLDGLDARLTALESQIAAAEEHRAA